jgi:hypothetical protein
MRYALKKPESVVVDLLPAVGDRPAVSVTFPAQPSLLSIRAARRAALEALRAGGPNADEHAADAFTIELIRHNIEAWSGIGNEKDEPLEPTHDVEIRDIDGNVTGVTPGTIPYFLAEPRFVEVADREWVLPWALADAEKNGLSPSLNGISAGAMPVDDTANSSVMQPNTDDAVTKKTVRRVRTKSTRRKPRPAKKPGA